MVNTFALNAETNATGYATAFHAGLASVLKELVGDIHLAHLTGKSAREVAVELELRIKGLS